MNIVVICSDTFRYDHMGFLKRQPVLTPNLDRLAAESACFSEFHLCSFPTVVNRIEVFTGRYTFPLIDWGALPMHFPVLGEVFQRHGFVTAFIADNPHLMKDGSGFGRGFDVVKDIPGQTDDIFQPKTAPMIELPCAIEKLEPRIRRLERYRRNAYWYRQRGTNTTETLFREAIRWLERPPERFFLWLDSFDPHEPWDAPKRYLEPYPWDPQGAEVTWPHNGPADRYSAAELANMRSLYKAEVSQSDYWIGRLLESMRTRGQLENTVVVFCSDHGYYLGEHGFVGKLRLGRPTPIYEELGHIPLLIRHPKGLGAGQTIPGLCQPPDLFVTALEFAGINRVPWSHGNSLVPRLHGHPSPQSFAVGGCHPRKGILSCLSVWTKDWSLVYSPVKGLDGSELFRRSDVQQKQNVIAENRSVAAEHFEMLRAWLEQLGVSRPRLRQLLHGEPFNRVARAKDWLWNRSNRRVYFRNFATYASDGRPGGPPPCIVEKVIAQPQDNGGASVPASRRATTESAGTERHH